MLLNIVEVYLVFCFSCLFVFIVFLYTSYHSVITMSKLLLLVVTSGVILGLWSTRVIERIYKRCISYGEHEAMGSVTHLYSTNSWYRYASMQANKQEKQKT